MVVRTSLLDNLQYILADEILSPYIAATLESPRSDQFILIEVLDRGIGVSPEVQSNLFKPSLDSDDCYSTGGDRLGLNCMATRMRVHGGACGMRPRDDVSHGSIFWIAIPYIPVELTKSLPMKEQQLLKSDEGLDACEPSPQESVHRASDICESKSNVLGNDKQAVIKADSPTAAKKKLQILVVDDSIPILKMTRKLLEQDGHTIHEAVNGYDALNYVKGKNIFYHHFIATLN